ncbi:MAG: hypothetical protein JXB46_02150 [Candidatus Eisenbacteria bacterium]|nr:hypothetical protein [Candidatus Eisenbacteria bacterium]
MSDLDIASLVEERKPLPSEFARRFQLKPKRGHKERELTVTGSAGSKFVLILRESNINPMDFSAILAYRPPQSNQLFRLRRFNGKSHEHSNRLEGQTFYDFHVHIATERYQDAGPREDAYAEPSTRFSDMSGALRCMLEDCGFELPEGTQIPLFP